MKSAASIKAEDNWNHLEREVTPERKVSGFNKIPSTFSEISQKLHRSPTKQRSPFRKRTKSLSNLRLKNQPAAAAASATTDKDLVPPRPPNAWILYRSLKFKELKAKHDAYVPSPSKGKETTPPSSASPGTTTSHPSLQAEVSRVISDMWKTETEEIKLSFVKLAEEKKFQHMEMFPDYKYRPRRQLSSITAKTVGTDSEKKSASATEKKMRPKVHTRANTFHHDPSKAITAGDENKEDGDNVNKDTTNVDIDVLDSPMMDPFIPFTEILIMKSSPVLEGGVQAIDSQVQFSDEMRHNDWFRAMASSTERDITDATTPSSSFGQIALSENYSYPVWDRTYTSPTEIDERPHSAAPSSAASNYSWNGVASSSGPADTMDPSSAASWHHSENIPWDCTDLIETLDDVPSDQCASLIPTPDYSGTSSPYHPYSNATDASSMAFSSSSLYLGISPANTTLLPTVNTAQQDAMQTPFSYDNSTSNSIPSASQVTTTTTAAAAAYEENHIPQFQESIPFSPLLTTVMPSSSYSNRNQSSSVDLHGQNKSLMWPTSPQMQKSVSSRPYLPSQLLFHQHQQQSQQQYQQHQQHQQHQYPSSDGSIHQSPTTNWSAHPVRPITPETRYQHSLNGKDCSCNQRPHHPLCSQVEDYTTINTTTSSTTSNHSSNHHHHHHHHLPSQDLQKNSLHQQQQQQQQHNDNNSIIYHHPHENHMIPWQDNYTIHQDFIQQLSVDDSALAHP